MSWVIIIMDSDDNKVKINWFYLSKIVLSAIPRDQFLYIFLNLITSTVLSATVFFS